jgi:hypothetical protein
VEAREGDGGLPWAGIAAFQLVGGFLIALTVFVILNGGPSWFGLLVYGALIYAVLFAGWPLLCTGLTIALLRARSLGRLRRAVLTGAAMGSVTTALLGILVLGRPVVISTVLAASGFAWTVVPLLIVASRSTRAGAVRAASRDSLN